MNTRLTVVVLFSVACVLSATNAMPAHNEAETLLESTQSLRERRSPDSPGNIRFEFKKEHDGNNRATSQTRAEYNQRLYQGKNGATVDASVYAERNHGGPGPKRDAGGMINLNIPLH